MTVEELINKLNTLPKDATVGIYFHLGYGVPRFKRLEKEIGINRNKNFVTLSFDYGVECTVKDMMETEEVK